MSISTKMRESGGVIEDIEDVKRCVQGNLCRCTGYRPIVQGFGQLCGKGSVAVNGKENGEDANISNGRGGEILRLSSPEVGGAWYQPTRLEDVQELMRSLDKFDIRGGDTGWYEVDRDSADNIINIAEVDALKKVEISDGMAHVGSALTLAQMESALKNTKASGSQVWYTVCCPTLTLQSLAAGTISSDQGSPLSPLDIGKSPGQERCDRRREHHVGQPRLRPEGNLSRHRMQGQDMDSQRWRKDGRHRRGYRNEIRIDHLGALTPTFKWRLRGQLLQKSEEEGV